MFSLTWSHRSCSNRLVRLLQLDLEFAVHLLRVCCGCDHGFRQRWVHDSRWRWNCFLPPCLPEEVEVVVRHLWYLVVCLLQDLKSARQPLRLDWRGRG